MPQIPITLADGEGSRTSKVNKMLADLYGRPLARFEKVSFYENPVATSIQINAHIAAITGDVLPDDQLIRERDDNWIITTGKLNDAFALAYGGVTPGIAAALESLVNVRLANAIHR